MPPIPAQAVSIQCPACGHTYQTNIQTIIDVQQQPELKQALLAGQLNVAVCPQCGAATMLGTPLFYHDAEKQLYLVFIPQELNLSAEQEEGLIGEHTSALMTSLSSDAPRGYLLQPRRMMALATLIDTILEADGIPREVLEQQRLRVDLISQLASTFDDEAQFQQIFEQHRAEVTPELIATINAFIEHSPRGQEDDSVRVLVHLREKLIALTGLDAEQPDTASDSDIHQAIDQLLNVSDEEMEEVLAELRPIIDYHFFETWTARIDELQAAGNTAEAERLSQRRTQILETVERMDQEAQAMFETGANKLRELLQADDMKAALQANPQQIDEAFMLVLSANIAQAQRAGQNEMAARLEEINRLAIEVIQESLPPEERLINTLMMTETPRQRNELLRSHAAEVTPAFVKKLNELADQQEQQGAKESTEKLRQLAREAGAMLF